MKYFQSASTLVATLPLFLSVSVLASPIDTAITTTDSINVILKQGEPNVASDWGSNDAERINRSFQPTLEMVHSVITAAPAEFDRVVKKYFNMADKNIVMNVFKSVLSKDTKTVSGNPLLSKITVWNKDHKKRCDGRLATYMDDWAAKDPQMEFCPAALKHKTLADTQCAELGDHVSYKMMTLSANLLTEYLVWTDLTSAAAGGHITIQTGGVGPLGVRTLDKSKAKFNVDSYVYFANELYFSAHCKKHFHRARAGVDEKDPACNNNLCLSG